MLNLNSFYLIILFISTLLSVFSANTSKKPIIKKTVIISTLILTTAIYINFTDLSTFADIDIYSKLDSSDDLGSKDREPLGALFIDYIRPLLPSLKNANPMFTCSMFLLVLSILFNPEIDLYKFSLFIAGPGFTLIFMQHRTFLGLSLFLLLSTIVTSKKIQYLKYVTILIHTSLLSSFFVKSHKLDSNKYSLKKAISITAVIYFIAIIASQVGLFPVISDNYIPIIKPTSMGFFIFCWIYILTIRNTTIIGRDNSTTQLTSLSVDKNYVHLMILIALMTPYIALSTRFFAIHASIFLLSKTDCQTQEKFLSGNTPKLALLMLLPNIFFFFLAPKEY